MADDHTASRLGWLATLLPALTFVVGLGLGAALLLAFHGGGDTAEAEQGTAGRAASPSAAGGDTVVTLPAACEQAAAKVSEAYRLLRQAVDQVRDFQADDLVETLNELEDVDGQTRPLAQECSQVSVSTSPTPTPSTSGSTATAEPSATPAG